MALSDQAEKLAEYRARLEAGHADRISPEHVDRVLGKLEAKRAKLTAKLTASSARMRCWPATKALARRSATRMGARSLGMA